MKCFKYFLIVTILVLAGCISDVENQDSTEVVTEAPALVLNVIDENHEYSVSYANHIAKVFDYTKIPFQNISIDSFNLNPSVHTPMVVYINTTKSLKDKALNWMNEFVAQGGTLVITSVNEDPRGAFLSGIKPNADYAFNLDSRGIKFTSDVLPNMKNVSVNELKQNTCLKAENFRSDVKVLAVASTDSQQPIIIENLVGNGSVIHFNTNMMLEKTDRGLFFAAALKGLEGVPYPIANVSTLFLDDFPSPIYPVKLEPIASEMNVTQMDFVINTWWPDMVELADKYDLKYSAYLVFSYDNVMRPPFPFVEWDNSESSIAGKNINAPQWLSRQLMEKDHELALHGYNHQSLMEDVWPSAENMRLAFNAARKKWVLERLGGYPQTYVAPSNEIDSIGLAQLALAMPEIEVMSTTYDGELPDGGNREFDYDPYQDKFFNYPRISSGYVINDAKQYAIQSLYLYSGIWTHFIHPDDVFQLPDKTNASAGKYNYRNELELNWNSIKNNKKGMLSYWEDQLNLMSTSYPMMRYATTLEASKKVKAWRSGSYQYKKMGNIYSVTGPSSNTNAGQYWILYSTPNNELALEAILREKSIEFAKTRLEHGILFTLKTINAQISFTEDKTLTNDNPYFADEVVAMVLEDYADFEKERNDYEKGIELNSDEFEITETAEEVEEENVEDDALIKETQLNDLKTIKQGILTHPFDSIKYRQYIELSNQLDEVENPWLLLEKVYQQDEGKALKYLAILKKAEDYPDDATHKLWLERQLDNEPDPILLEEYLANFYEEGESQQFDSLYKRMIKTYNTDEVYARYIRYLANFHPELLPDELAGKNPENYPLLHPYSTTITYAYSDANRLKEALEWAPYSDDIALLTRLQWLADLQAYNKMQETFVKSSKSTDEDRAFVGNTWYDAGEYERGALVSQKLPENENKERFKNRFNSDVRYFEPDVQKFLIEKTPDLFYADTLSGIKHRLRLTEHNWVEFNSAYVIDNFDQSVWDNAATFHLRTRKLKQHSFSLLHSSISDLTLDVEDVTNISHNLFGLGYRFQTRENTPKPLWWAGGGVMASDNDQLFYSLLAGVSLSNTNSYKSLSLTFDPVKTGPALTQEIYKAELIAYYERSDRKKWQPILAVNASSYTNSVSEVAFTGRLFRNFTIQSMSRFSPYAEGYVSYASADQLSGNPYWVVSDRIYGGGGLAWIYGKDPYKLTARVEGGFFLDTFTESFARLNGNVSIPIHKYTFLVGRFEFFNQARYYSNGFQLGVKHYLDRKRPYIYQKRNYEFIDMN